MIMEGINAGVNVSVNEAKTLDAEDLENFLKGVREAAGAGTQIDALALSTTKKWWGLAETRATPERERDGRVQGGRKVAVKNLDELSFGFGERNERNHDEKSVAESRLGKSKVKEDDLEEQGVQDEVACMQISGLFISGAWPSREETIKVIDGTGRWLGTAHMTSMRKSGVKSLAVLKTEKVSFLELETWWKDGVEVLKLMDWKQAALVAIDCWDEAARALGGRDTSVQAICGYFLDYLTRKYLLLKALCYTC